MATQTRQNIEGQIVARALKDEAFKQKLLTNPDAAKTEIEKLLGQTFPAHVQYKVLQESADTAYVVLPYQEGMTEEQLDTMKSGVDITLPCTFGSITFH